MIVSELEKRIHDGIKGGKKNRVVLEDYDVVSDVKNRLLLAQINQDEYAILEEILYSPLKFSIEKLCKNCELPIEDVRPFVEKFEESGLYAFDGETLVVKKEKRKYFEMQIEKFEEEFTPGMEFLQSLLKNVAIHVLPVWYHIPRSSNNIFESLVEKYLQTPRVYQRYLVEMAAGNDILKKILEDLEKADGHKIYMKDLCEMHGVTREEMTETVILGEFNFLFCSSFEPHLDGWIEVVTPFSEWCEYLVYLKTANPKSIEAHFEIDMKRNNEYAFIEDMATLLNLTKECDISVSFESKKDLFVVEKQDVQKVTDVLEGRHIDTDYVNRLVNKLLVLGLGLIEEVFLKPTAHAGEWVAMPIEKRSHITFKHPHNFLDIRKISPLSTERSIMEIQKSMAHVAKSGWVYLDDFFMGCPVELSDDHKVSLKKQGRNWQYALPAYSDEEAALVRYTIMEWFFESGIVQSGKCNDRECFKLTHLGRALFV